MVNSGKGKKVIFGRSSAEIGAVICLVGVGVVLCFVIVEWFASNRGALGAPGGESAE